MVRIAKGSHEGRGVVRLHTTLAMLPKGLVTDVISHSHTQRPEAPQNYGVIIFYSFCSL